MTSTQYLADTDQFYHDPDIGSYGENIAVNSGSGGQVTTENVLSREFVQASIIVCILITDLFAHKFG